MMQSIQDVLLYLYERVRATGLLSTPLGRRVFECSYNAYKSAFEAGPVKRLAPLIAPDTHVLDIGANIGFFTRRFARWVSGSGRVIAVEPEQNNYDRLNANIDRDGLRAVVEPIQAAVADASGVVLLELNPNHPGDHKIGASGVPIRALTIDEIVAQRGWPRVSLIKIDVQGGEERVIRGARATLARFRPTLFVEVDDAHLRAAGSSAEALLKLLISLGYRVCELTRAGPSAPLSMPDCLEKLRAKGYTDFLFVPAAVSDEPGGA
jgi:FkbM family methyltransferase